MNATIAEFLLRSPSDSVLLAQRARILAALAELPVRRRQELEEAVGKVCRAIAAQGGTASVRFALCQRSGHRYVEVSVRNERTRKEDQPPSTGNADAPAAAEDEGSISLQRLGEMLDEFDSSSWPRAGAVIRMAQALSPAFSAPTESEAARWSEMLRSRSAEDALVLALRHSRSVSVQLSYVQDREALHEQIGGATTTEHLAMLSLVASKSRNLISFMDAGGTISWVNDAFVEATGYSPIEAIGKRPDELLFGPSTDPAAVREYQQAFRNGYDLNQDFMLYRRDGRTFWAECNLIPIRDDHGELTRWLSVDVDVTKRYETEEALRAAKAQAEASARVKSEFLANMSHEIRTPMNAIIGMTELTLTSDLNNEQREYLQTVQSSAESLLRLLNDILDLSKIEAGKLEIDAVDFNLADTIRDTLKALVLKARQKGLELAAHVPTDLPELVRGDPVRLKQILFNLVGNAIKFTEQGEVVVDVELQWKTEDEVGVHFAVRDTGIGIPKEKLNKIFEAFTQAESATTRHYGGTGLGLTITAELVRLMHGKIWVESVVHKGSTFHFTLQLQLAERAKPSSGKARATRGTATAARDDSRQDREWADSTSTDGRGPAQRLRILVADDHEANRQLATTVLSKRGHHCTEATDGAEALSLLERESFDVVLMDVQMPNVDGFQAVRAIRQKEIATGQHALIIALTAHAMKGDREKCLAAGMDAYLAKPLRPRELVAVVESIVEANTAAAVRAATHVTATGPAATQEAGTSMFDFQAALESMDNEVDLLVQQMQFFVNDGPQLVEQIRQAVDQHDARQLELAAHRLKGLVARYAARKATELAYDLEQCGQSQQFDEAQERVEQLAPIVDQLVAAIRQYIAQHMGG